MGLLLVLWWNQSIPHVWQPLNSKVYGSESRIRRTERLHVDNTYPVPSRIERVDITDAVYAQIRRMILSGDLTPDSKINVDMLADSFGVSRSTVANALQSLALEDLVRIVPHRGTYVRVFSLHELKETYDVRLCLELWAAKKTVATVTDEQLTEMRRILGEFVPLLESTDRDDAATFAIKNGVFHTYLLDLANNSKLLDSYKRLHVEFMGYRIYKIRDARKFNERTLGVMLPSARMDHEEHEAIADAYASRDLGQAEKEITNNLKHALDNLSDSGLEDS